MRKQFFLLLLICSAILSLNASAQHMSIENKTSVLFTLPSLKTGDDAKNVGQALSGYENKIFSFNINADKSQVEVFYDSDHILIEDIMQILWKAGYNNYYHDSEGRKLEMSDGPHIKITYIKNE